MMMFLMLLSFLIIGSTISCKCRKDSTLSEDFAKTPMIFIGRVINKVPPILFGNVKYTMKVEEAFKVVRKGLYHVPKLNI
jgi:hypothetical protein